MRAKHPLDEVKAAKWHFRFFFIGVAHLIAGVGMCWFHGVSSYRHWLDRHNSQ